MIAESYGRLKKRLVEDPVRALEPISKTISTPIREHPLEAAATAVGGGIAAYGIARMMTQNENGKERKNKPGKKKKTKRRHDPMMDILSAILPVALPYLTRYLEKSLDHTPERNADNHIPPN